MATKTVKKVKTTKNVEAKDAKERQKEFYEEKVSVRVERPEGIKEDSFTVTLNGKNYQIRYGVDVKVPRAVKLIIEESARNRMAAEDKAAEAAQAFLDGKTALGEV